MSYLNKAVVAVSFSAVCGAATAAEPCTYPGRPELGPGDSVYRYFPNAKPIPGVEMLVGPDCKLRIYKLNNATGNYDLDGTAAKSAGADIPRTFTLPKAAKPDPQADMWFNRLNYLPSATPSITASFKHTNQSATTKDASFGECYLSNGVVVPARGAVMLDNRTIYSFIAKPDTGTCQIMPALKVHVIDVPVKTSQMENKLYSAVYNPNDFSGQPKYQATVALPIWAAGAFITSYTLMMGLHYLNPLLGQDIADPARKLAQPLPNAVVLSPAVTAGIDAQRRALGLAIGDVVDIFLSPQYNLLGPLKLFTLLGISPNSQAKPTAEFCRAARQECRVQCNDELAQPGLDGRVNQGNPFFICVNECLKSVGCQP